MVERFPVKQLSARLSAGTYFLLTAEEHSAAAAAEHIAQIAQAHLHARIRVKLKAPESAGLPAVGAAEMLHAVQLLQVFLVCRIHAHRPAHMLQSNHLVA